MRLEGVGDIEEADTPPVLFAKMVVNALRNALRNAHNLRASRIEIMRHSGNKTGTHRAAYRYAAQIARSFR